MKRWYVVQVYAGYEEIIKVDLLKQIKESGLEDFLGEILIPSAKLKHFFDAAENKENQLFPGYMLIEMDLSPEIIRLISSNPRVVRFLGGKDPAPLTQKEIERILSQMRGEVIVASSKKSEFVVGSETEIKEGPFAGFMGIIDGIDEENERLTVMVSIFGRMTPVELNFDQVKR